MKYTFKFFQIVLLICGVFGVETDEVKTVSVMEGDSVTLKTDVTETEGIILILWRFGDPTIAQIRGKDISYPSHIDTFRGKLQLDSTGSLTIKNMRIKHSGLYKLQIDLNSGTSRMTFNVTVYESPSVNDAGKAEMKTVSVMEGDSVTLQTDVTETHGDELIVWRFGDEGKLIAKHDIEAKSSPLHDTDERFRGRLKLDEKTGSLTVTNTRTTDSGLYTVKISSNKQTLYKRFTVTVSEPGLSSGAKAGIVIGVLLAFAAAAAAAGVIYYRRKISEIEGQKLKTVMEGEDVTLNTDVTEVKGDDLIEWRFGDKGSLIAEIRGGVVFIYDTGLDERFLDRLKLDKKTGSLTIMNTRNADTGIYELKISQDSKIKYKMFNVSVCVKTVSVFEGDPLILKTDTEIQRDDIIEWRFGNNGPLIAEIRGGIILLHYDVPNGRFLKGDGVELDKTTGSLTITNTEMKHAGVYHLQITSIRGVAYKTFRVTVRVRKISVEQGKNVILNPETEIQKDDQIQWMFGDQDILIAEIRGGKGETLDVADVRFRGRLRLDEKTGSLIITNTTPEQSGVYKLQISSSRGPTNKTFVVRLYSKLKSVIEGESVTLDPETEIKEDDLIQWRFGDQDILIAEIRGGKGDTRDDDDVRFRGRLKLEEKTGSLIITRMRPEHAGVYKLQTISSRGTTNKTFKAVVVYSAFGETTTVWEGEDVTLSSDTYIVKDEVNWFFNDGILATGKNGDINKTPYCDERFKDRLELNHQTGSLTIKNIRPSDSGVYHLKFLTLGIERTFDVTVHERNISVEEGKNVILNPETEIQKDDLIQWKFGYQDILIAEIKGGKGETHDDVADGRFRDRLKLDEKTGYLTITDMRPEDTGVYKLQISSSRGTTNKTFVVSVSARKISVKEGESVTLNSETEIQKDDQIQWMFGDQDILIAEIRGGTGKTHDDDVRFRGRLKLDEKTGSLIITESIPDQSGVYKLQIRSSRGTTNKTFAVTVFDKCFHIPSPPLKLLEAENRVNDSTTVEMPPVNEEDRDAGKYSATVEMMPLLNEEDQDAGNEQEGMSSL